jgi:valyl-tRNA synthetase
MRVRYDNWVTGLNGDWLVSRQRFFGVPVPVWYPLDDGGNPVYDTPIIPADSQLPLDPSTDLPDGYDAAQRGVPGGFIGDPDVLDTWATSSLTPHIAARWSHDDDLFGRVFPMDLRPQAHEIIRTWLFSTLLRSHYEHDELPWRASVISGWILDPDRKKMSKSKGNVVTPAALLDEYGSDAVRYWAASARPGTDTAYDTGQMKVGRKLAIKLLNASKFVLGIGEPEAGAAVTEPMDRAMLADLADTVQAATDWFESYDYARALQRTEAFFWNFCDNYVELVKKRAYGDNDMPGVASARAALRIALSAVVRLLAPFLPFATEEVWSWWNEGSVHRAQWPTKAETEAADGADREVLTVASDVIAAVRKAKSEAKVSMSTEIAAIQVTAPADFAERVREAEADLLAAGHIGRIEHAVAEGEILVSVSL